MKRAGNTFRILFIIQAVSGLRLESDSDLSNDFSGASEPESFNATGDVSDYDDVQGALMEKTDERKFIWGPWLKTPFEYVSKFGFDTCDDSSSSLAAVGSDVNSSSELLIHGLDDGEQEQQGLSIKMGANASSTNAKVRINPVGKLETKGTTLLEFTINFAVSKTFKYTKRWTGMVFHGTFVAVYINVGLNIDLTMSGNVGFKVTVPVNWDFCVTTSGGACWGKQNTVSSGAISFHRWLGVTVRGKAQVSTSIQIEKIGLVTTSAEVTSTMQLYNTQCTVRYDWHLRIRSLSTIVKLLNLATKLISLGTGICFNEFTDIKLANLLNGKIWEGACHRDLR